MTRYKCLFSLILLLFTPISYASCDSDFIRDKTNDGSIIILGAGSTWRVSSVDQVETSIWLAGSEVVMGI